MFSGLDFESSIHAGMEQADTKKTQKPGLCGWQVRKCGYS
jgi:hypothetical protein